MVTVMALQHKNVAIVVRNRTLKKPVFDRLCDSLSALRHWCHDYRINIDVCDTKVPTEMYWQSYCYIETDQFMIRVTEESVTENVERFLDDYDLPHDSVTIAPIKLG